MSSVRIQLTVGSEMSLEFARLDMSKLSDTHAIVMRKELGGRAARKRRAALWQKEEGGRVRCYRMPVGCLASTRRSQGDGGLRNDCLRLLL